MGTAAKSAYGTILKRLTNTVAELTKIGTPEITLETKDVTNHQSADGFREHIGTLFDAGEVQIEGNFISSDTNGQVGLQTDQAAKTLQSFTIAFPNGAEWTFSALVTKFKIGDATPEGEITFSATLKISGKPNLTITSSADLSALVITTGVLVPVLTAGVYDYVVTIATGEVGVLVKPTCASATSITVNGMTVASGADSGSIALGAAKSITACQIITKTAGKADRVYNLKLIRA